MVKLLEEEGEKRDNRMTCLQYGLRVAKDIAGTHHHSRLKSISVNSSEKIVQVFGGELVESDDLFVSIARYLTR